MLRGPVTTFYNSVGPSSVESHSMLTPRTFRDVINKLSLRKKLLILVSIGVVLPLSVLTYLQYQSLAELQYKTKGAFKDNMRQGLTRVEQVMKQRLEEIATQTFSPVDHNNLWADGGPEEFEHYFADVKRSHPEIEEIFAFGGLAYEATASSYGYVYIDHFVQIDKANLPQTNFPSIFQKAWARQGFLDANRKYLFLHDPCDCPPMWKGAFLFYPLHVPMSAAQSAFVGVQLSEDFVKNDLIAGSIEKTLNRYHGNTASIPAMAITISDENQRVIYSNARTQDEYFFQSNLDRPFSNWRAAVGMRDTNLDALARDSFLQSAGVTVLVLLVLLCGVALIVRATDREARLAQAKSNFVANVSHELKTPLSLLSLFSEILELGRVNTEEKKTEYYRIIRHESLRLNKMIDNILDFSKIEAGRKTYNFAAADMTEVIEEVLSSYRYQIKNSGFDMRTDLQSDLPPVMLDRDAMAQAISNLLDNAIKYSRDVKQLLITTKTLDSKLSIEIADRGIGIPRAEQAKIFEKFYRVGNGLVHDVKGSGLGLSLVKHIVDAHQGTISVESEEGKGSRFTILLPVATEPADAQA